jgi:hypothetical protein
MIKHLTSISNTHIFLLHRKIEKIINKYVIVGPL